jgi:hypothetical protein
LVGIGYFRPFHDALHNIFDNSTSGHFPASKFYRLLSYFLLFLRLELGHGSNLSFASWQNVIQWITFLKQIIKNNRCFH